MLKTSASVFGLPVPDPEKFGVIELDQNDKIIDIVEKPEVPKSNLIIPGIYFFDSMASSYTKTLKPSQTLKFDKKFNISDTGSKFLN